MEPGEARALRQLAQAEKPQEQALEMPPVEERYPFFGWAVNVFEDGSKTLIIQIPGLPGKLMRIPFDAEEAQKLGEAFTAPHVEVAKSLADLPPIADE